MFGTYKPRDRSPVKGGGLNPGGGGGGGGSPAGYYLYTSVSTLAGGTASTLEFLLARTVIPAGAMGYGTMLRFSAGFKFANNSSPQPFQLKIRRNFGGSAEQLFGFGNFTPLDLNSDYANGAVRAEMMSVSPNIGSGTLRCISGVCMVDPPAIDPATVYTYRVGLDQDITGLSLTSQQTIDLTGTMQNSDADNIISCNGAFLEIITPSTTD